MPRVRVRIKKPNKRASSSARCIMAFVGLTPDNQLLLDDDGNTHLHLAVASMTPPHLKPAVAEKMSADDLDFLMFIYGTATMMRMATTVNNSGALPYDIVCHDEYKNESLKEPLLRLMIQASQLPPIQQPINLEGNMNQIDDSASDQLRQNLLIATLLVNEVRKHLKQSSTHPGLNTTPHTILPLNEEIKRNRASNEPCNSIQKLIRQAKHYMSKQSGNCYEHTIVALYTLAMKKIQITVDIIHIGNGDHVFLAIDRGDHPCISDISTWGEHAVICDPWSGKAYPAYQAPEKLRDYRMMMIDGNAAVNILIHYKPYTASTPQYAYVFTHTLVSELRLVAKTTSTPSQQDIFRLFVTSEIAEHATQTPRCTRPKQQ